MRFFVAAVLALGLMTVDFETSFKPSYALQATAHSPFTSVPEQVGDDDTVQPVDHSVRQEDATTPAETNGLSVVSKAAPQVEAPALIQDEPKKDFCDALKEAAESSDIPIAFFARLLWQESRFRTFEVSRAGAQGVAQFMPGTAAEVGLDDPFDPFKALPASAKFLRKLHNEFGNLGLAAAAYNAGSGRIQKWLSRRGVLPRETRDYVRIITGNDTENWLEETKALSLQLELPGGAPCEGVGGLSKAKDVAIIPVALAPSTSDAIKKAEVEALRLTAAKSEAAARAKIKVVLLLKKPKAPLKQLASARAVWKKVASQPARRRPPQSAGVRTVAVTRLMRAATKAAERPRQVRLASANSR
jgi:hypothetical protein